MNEKLKQEYLRIKLLNHRTCVAVDVDLYDGEDGVLDVVGRMLACGQVFIELSQGRLCDGEFLELLDKVSQLVNMYDGTLVVSGNPMVCYFADVDGVVLRDGSLDTGQIKELLGEDILVGYRVSEQELDRGDYTAIKRGVDYITTPSISTNVAIEYAKWVYENIEKPVYVGVDSHEKYKLLNAQKIDRFTIPITLTDTILHTP